MWENKRTKSFQQENRQKLILQNRFAEEGKLLLLRTRREDHRDGNAHGLYCGAGGGSTCCRGREKFARLSHFHDTPPPQRILCKLTGNGSRNWISEEVSEVNWTEIKRGYMTTHSRLKYIRI